MLELFHDGVECYEDSLECLILRGKLKEPFGPWEANVDVFLTFNFEDMNVTEYGDEGEILCRRSLLVTCKVE